MMYSISSELDQYCIHHSNYCLVNLPLSQRNDFDEEILIKEILKTSMLRVKRKQFLRHKTEISHTLNHF